MNVQLIDRQNYDQEHPNYRYSFLAKHAEDPNLRAALIAFAQALFCSAQNEQQGMEHIEAVAKGLMHLNKNSSRAEGQEALVSMALTQSMREILDMSIEALIQQKLHNVATELKNIMEANDHMARKARRQTA
ncbi:hypothetical protein HYW84_01715 [Candidatus Peregrinibacteria bacterium]|nr:hypothetical protein [Candidatus Peregrinibacteria bacterium]